MATGTLTTNTTTDEVRLVRPHVHLSGTFGGGTIKFQFEDDNGTWRDIAGASYTSATDIILDFRRAVTIRGSLSGATAPSLVWVIN